MATYLPGGTDTGFNPVQYSPNLSLLANSIDRATARYETNFAKVSKGYNDILSASILNDGYSQKRDQYLSEIKDKLKTISTTDLSVQSNVNDAENLYAPFWEDKTMLSHIADTKQRQSQLQEQNRIAKEHPDYDNSTAMAVMNYNMNKIKTSKDPNIINTVPLTKATALKNNPKEFQEWLKTNNYEIIAPLTVNGRVYSQTNGDGTQRTYSELFNEYLGNSAQDQYQMYGEYYKIQAIQDIKATEKLNSGIDISDDEAEQKIPIYYEGQAVKNLNQKLEDYKLETSTLQKNYENAKRNNNVEAAELLNKRKLELDELIVNSENNITSIKEKKTINGVDYKTTMDDIFKNPTGFFAMTKKQTDALIAGNMAANKQSVKINADDAYWNDVKLKQDSDQFNQKLAYDYTALDFKGGKNSLSSGKKDATGADIPFSNTTPTVEMAPSNIEIQNSIERKRTEIADMGRSGLDLMVNTLKTSTSQYLGNIAKSTDISILSSGLNKDPKTFVGPDKVAYDKTYNAVKEKLKNNGVDVSNIHGPVGLFSALTKFHEDKFNSDLEAREQYKIKGVIDPSLNANIVNELNTTYSNLQEARKRMDNAYAENLTFDKAINSKLGEDKYKDIRVDKGNGKYELISAQYLVDHYPDHDMYSSGNKKIKIPLSIMEQYINGKMDAKYEQVSENFVVTDPTTKRKYIVNNLINSLGNSRLFKEKLDKGYKMLDQNMDQNELKRYQDQTGNMGKAIIYKSPNKDGADLADALAFDVFGNLGNKATQVDDQTLIVGAEKNDDLTELINKKLIPIIKEDPYKGLTATTLYNIGHLDPTKRNVKFNYDLSELKINEDDAKALREAGYNGEFTIQLNSDADVKGFPQKYSSFYTVLLDKSPNEEIKQSAAEEKLGLKYSFYKDGNNEIYCKAGYEQVVVEKEPGTLKNIVKYKWIDLNPSRKGQPYLDAGGGFTTLPPGKTIDDYLEYIKSGLSDQFSQNNIILQTHLPVVNSQVTYANEARFKELDKNIYK